MLKLIQCNMNKIELTADEIKVIKQQLNGEIEVWNADDYQQKHLTSVIDKADALLEELDAYDEMIDEKDGDTILWFWDKYKAGYHRIITRVKRIGRYCAIRFSLLL